MTSGGNAGAGAGADGFAGSVDDPTEATGFGVDSLTEAAQAMEQTSGYYAGLNAAATVMERTGMPQATAREAALSMQDAREGTALGGLTTRSQMALGAATFGAQGLGMVASIGQMMGRAAFAAGWDVQDPSGMDYGDTPQSTGGQGGVGVDMAAPAPTPAPAPPPAPPPVEPVAAAPAPAPAPSGPTAATGATATPLSAVGAASTRARRRGRSSTIATSTLGVPQSATVARKTLLGS